MEINIPIEQLQKRSLFIATPMYGGQCAGMYTKSVNDLASLCMHYKINAKFYYLFNESLITRARNYCCDEFLRSDCTHMIFIDSDIAFWMGWVTFRDINGKTTKVDKSWGYKLDDDGIIRIILHHSSLPYSS